MDPYLGEVRIFGFNYAPLNWAFCNGATLQLRQFSALFSLMGTSFGGNGSTTFMLPNLAGRGACGTGTGPGQTPRQLGDAFGLSQVSLTTQEIAAHTHQLNAYEGGSGTRTAAPDPNGALSSSDLTSLYATGTPNTMMSPMAIGPAGGNQPHSNMQPSLAMNYCIAVQGMFPTFP